MIWKLFTCVKANNFMSGDGATLRICGGMVWGVDADHAMGRTEPPECKPDETPVGNEVAIVREVNPKAMADALRRLGYAVHEPGTWAELTPAEVKA